MSFKLTNDSLAADAQESVICTVDYNGVTAGDVVYIADANYAIYLEWLAVPNTPDPAISTAESLELDRKTHINGVRALGMQKIQAIIPAIKSYEDLLSIRDWWVAMSPALRANFPTFQQAADVYIAAKDAITFLNTATAPEIAAYDINTDPTWPA